MGMVDELDMSALTLKLAEVILLSTGRISVEDIKAMPFLDNDQEVELIVDYLREKFGAKNPVISGHNEDLCDWEELIVLNSAV